MRELVGPSQALNTTRTRYQIMSPTITLWMALRSLIDQRNYYCRAVERQRRSIHPRDASATLYVIRYTVTVCWKMWKGKCTCVFPACFKLQFVILNVSMSLNVKIPIWTYVTICFDTFQTDRSLVPNCRLRKDALAESPSIYFSYFENCSFWVLESRKRCEKSWRFRSLGENGSRAPDHMYKYKYKYIYIYKKEERFASF